MTEPRSIVLCVEPDRAALDAIRADVDPDACSLLLADTLEAARQQLQQTPVDVLLLDLRLAATDQFAFLRSLRDHPAWQHIPVILVHATGLDAELLQAFQEGASDSVRLPLFRHELRIRIRTVLKGRRQQEELRRLNDALAAGTRNKSEFLANMSHEIRTPMNGVVAMTGLLLESPLNSDQQEMVETIRSSGETLLEIVNEILDFSKIEAGKLEIEEHSFQLRTCVEEALDLLTPRAAEKHLELACDLPDSVPRQFRGDSSRIRQVLLNLLNNALKFTATGEVAIAVQIPNSIETPPRPGDIVPVRFTVRDTGPGIPPEQLVRLFKPFTQGDKETSRKFGGTGLGLTICKTLVELMGGRIWVDSEPGLGSTFSFELPLLVETDETPALPDAHSDLKGKTALVVDDNATNRKILALQTARWGMQPTTTPSAREALHWLKQGRRFDIGILDLQMPEMDGLQLALEIRKLQPTASLPLLLLSSVGLRAEHPDLGKSPFNLSLLKPVKQDALRQSLLHLLGSAPQPESSPAPARPVAPPAPTPSPLQEIKLLLVEDNLINQKVARRLLEGQGFTPAVANNGREALDHLTRSRADIILMDMQMPEMDGYEATRQIRSLEQHERAPLTARQPVIIVALTANAMKGDRERCLKAGMDDYLTKPVLLPALKDCLQKWTAVVQERKTSPIPPAAPAPHPRTTPPPKPPDTNDMIDWERVREFTNGDPGETAELFRFYHEQTLEVMAKLRRAVDAASVEDVRRLAHTAAGASASVGLLRLTDEFRDLEHKARAGSIAGARNHLDRLDTLLAQFYAVAFAPR